MQKNKILKQKLKLEMKMCFNGIIIPLPSLVIWYGRPNQMSSNFGPHALVLGISAVVLVNNSNTDDGRFVDPCPTESRRICRTSLQEPTLHSWPSTERFWWTSTRSRSFSRNDWSHHGTFYRFTCHCLRSLIHSLKKFLKINPGTFLRYPSWQQSIQNPTQQE